MTNFDLDLKHLKKVLKKAKAEESRSMFSHDPEPVATLDTDTCFKLIARIEDLESKLDHQRKSIKANIEYFDNRVIYRGLITESPLGENDNALMLLGLDRPLAEIINSDIDDLGRYLSVVYFVSDHSKPIEDLQSDLIKSVMGLGDVTYLDRYSEMTGYLWTDEWLKVGGHDLLEELRSYRDKFLHLEITYNKKKPKES